MGFLESVRANQGVGTALVCLMILVWILFKFHCGRAAKMVKLPQGPPSLPVIGNLHILGKLPHRTLCDLSQKYGPLMFIRLGCVPTVVASSPDMAKEILKTHDLVFASRPPVGAAKNMLYNSKDMVFSPYGSYWRQMRKICILQLFCPERVESFQSVRAEEISHMINSIMQDGQKGSSTVNVSTAVTSFATDMTCRMAFGKKYIVEGFDGKGFKAFLQEYMFLVGAFSIGDFIPYLKWMDPQGLKHRQIKVHKILDAFFEKVIEEHVGQDALQRQRDLVDVLLSISRDNDTEMEITRDNIKAVIIDMLTAGTATSSEVLEWGMSELLKNPSAMKKAQDELEKVIGLNRTVRESDLPHLQYLQAVVKETLRLHPPAPLLAPHESREACIVSGYEIPAKARVLVNVWAIGRDPQLWEDADMFKPERFIGSCIDVKGQNFELLPFGSGRRDVRPYNWELLYYNLHWHSSCTVLIGSFP